ncbi:tRNA-intron lyase, partial [Candidatus Bathyarchaeota archaeon]
MPGEARYVGGEVVVDDPELIADLKRRGYGREQDGSLVLEPWEALYLVEKGRIEVSHPATGRPLSFQELLDLLSQADGWLWARYLIYRDLRERGYVVKGGFGLGLDFRLYDRGDYGRKPARYL